MATKIDFKINTNSSNYRIEVYRLGYYGGMGARLVTTMQHTGVQNQPTPLRDATTGLVDAGNWSSCSSWNVPVDAVSGVYIAKLVRQDGTFGENHIPFIVRDDSSTSESSSKPRTRPGRPIMAGAEQISMAATVLRRVKVGDAPTR